MTWYSILQFCIELYLGSLDLCVFIWTHHYTNTYTYIKHFFCLSLTMFYEFSLFIYCINDGDIFDRGKGWIKVKYKVKVTQCIQSLSLIVPVALICAQNENSVYFFLILWFFSRHTLADIFGNENKYIDFLAIAKHSSSCFNAFDHLPHIYLIILT